MYLGYKSKLTPLILIVQILLSEKLLEGHTSLKQNTLILFNHKSIKF